ncbi:ABC-type nitrate/sulfonate/bicarbonate transport systems, periplasmic components [Rhodovastum atsumiense]|nr:ABC transporter substrate-binding protein [Rhodovastum atsumiense]CAH2601932.1 ABC-type nitrate/sulfonate/bicarbonate transport systems, periplasmic components [Rhodovastum atsumiense]
MDSNANGVVAGSPAPERPPAASGPRRRNLLKLGAVVGTAGMVGALPRLLRAADLAAPALIQTRTKITIIWSPSALCLVVIGLAKRQGIFDKYGLDVDILDVGYDTTTVVQAVALGKADATSNFVLSMLKPLEGGFDMKLTAGTHGGCSILVASRAAGIATLQDLRGKRIGMKDLTSPMKMLYDIHLGRNGLPPDSYTWRQYPPDVFTIAVQKGEIDAFADGYPNAYFAIKRSNGTLFELAANGTGELGKRTCCALGISGRLIRDNRPAAAALTRAMVEASLAVDHNNFLAVEAAQFFSPRQVKPEELGEMIAAYPYDEERGCPTGEALRRQILWYAQGLKETGVLRSGTDPDQFTNRIVLDLLTS